MKSTSRLRVLSEQDSTSFGVCLFLQGVIRKYGRKAHMSGLHRDINVPRNYLTSRRLQKPREESGGRTGPEAGCPPSFPGRPPSIWVQSGLCFVGDLHRPKGSRITVQSMSVWSNGPYLLEGTIKQDPLAPGGKSLSTLIHCSSMEKKPLIKIRATTSIRHLD